MGFIFFLLNFNIRLALCEISLGEILDKQTEIAYKGVFITAVYISNVESSVPVIVRSSENEDEIGIILHYLCTQSEIVVP